MSGEFRQSFVREKKVFSLDHPTVHCHATYYSFHSAHVAIVNHDGYCTMYQCNEKTKSATNTQEVDSTNYG